MCVQRQNTELARYHHIDIGVYRCISVHIGAYIGAYRSLLEMADMAEI